MTSKIAAALDHFDAQGEGASLTQDEVDSLKEFVMLRLMDTGVPVDEAHKIVKALYWGSWSDGWERGYQGARSHYEKRIWS